MTLEFLPELPKHARRTRHGGEDSSYTSSTVAAFIEGGEASTHVTIEGRDPQTVYRTLHIYLRRNPGLARRVTVRLSGGEVYLHRIDR